MVKDENPDEKFGCDVGYDIFFPYDIKIGNKPREKVEKYQVFMRELERIWKCKSVEVVPGFCENFMKGPEHLSRTDIKGYGKWLDVCKRRPLVTSAG